MRTLISIIIFTGIPFYALCQIHNYGVTLVINEGTTIYINGSYNNVNSGGGDGALDMDGKMVVIGNWINNAANNALINVDAVGTITMAGTSMQTISGANATAFETLEINNSAGGTAVKLDTNINVYDSLIITDGNIDLNGNNINLGNLGLLSGENNDNRIYGTSGEVIASRNLTASSVFSSIAGLGIDITTDATAPGSTQIKRSHSEIELNVSTNKSILRGFDITPAFNTGLNATLKINYFYNEMNSLNESDFTFYKSPTGANPWAERSSSVISISDNYVEETGLNDFSKWTIGQKGVALPIELLSFTGYNAGDKNILEWTTATEINNDYFTLERAVNHLGSFDIVGTIDGAGNSSQPLNYQYSDALNNNESPAPATIYYYRLKQTDFDGTYTYSNIIAIGIDGVELIKVFPNPSVDEINYMVASGDTTEATVELIDMLGRETLYKKVKLNTGLNILKTDVSSLATGQYYLRISVSNGLHWSGKQFVIHRINE